MYQGPKNDQGERHGKGIYYYKNNFFVYEGDFVNGRKEGTGILKFGDGGFYEGEFSENEISGNGIRRYPDGTTYQGEFWMGERHGKGVLNKSDSSTYEGEWSAGRLNGKGEMKVIRDNSSIAYKGFFRDHMPHGLGEQKIRTEDEDENDIVITRKGEFQNGVLDGDECCVEVRTNKEQLKRYIGPFVMGKKEGIGNFVYEKLIEKEEEKGLITLSQCQFKNDECVELPSNIFCVVVHDVNVNLKRTTSGKSIKQKRSSKRRGSKGAPKVEEEETNGEEGEKIDEDELDRQKIHEFHVKEKLVLPSIKAGSASLPQIRCFLCSKIAKEKKEPRPEDLTHKEPVIIDEKKETRKKGSSRRKGKQTGRRKSIKKETTRPGEEEDDENVVKMRKFFKESGRIIRCRLIKIKDEFLKPPKIKKKGKKAEEEEKNGEENEVKWYEKYKEFVVKELDDPIWEKKIVSMENDNDDDEMDEEEDENDSVDQERKKKKKKLEVVFEIDDLPDDLTIGTYTLKFEDGCPNVEFREGHVIEPFFLFFQIKKSGK